MAIVSGIGCTGRVAGYVKLDSFHTTHGRAIPFATGLKLANPELKVVVYSRRRRPDRPSAATTSSTPRAATWTSRSICVNNFTYGMTGGQVAPTTPLGADRDDHAPYGDFEHPFNLPYLADACGAVYVARWTAYHVRQLAKAMKEALRKKGFSFIEIISPCPTLYQRRNRLGDGARRDEVLQGEERGQERRRHRGGRHRLPGRDHRRQVRRPRAARPGSSAMNTQLRDSHSATSTVPVRRTRP